MDEGVATTVAVVQTRPETCEQDHARLLRLAGFPAADSLAPPLAICLDRDPRATRAWPAAMSPPWQIEGVVRGLLADGWAPGDLVLTAFAAAGRPIVPLVWQTVAAACGLAPVRCGTMASAAGPPLLILAALRTDRRLGLSASLATLAAHLLPASQWDQLAAQPAHLVSAWRRLGEAAPVCGVIDAAVAGVGREPSLLEPVACHLLLASRDLVALDAVAARLAGFAGPGLPLIDAAARAQLGCADPRAIRLVGDVSAPLPQLGLAAASGYRGHPRARSDVFATWRRRFEALRARFACRTRRNRQRFARTAWGRLYHEYLQDARPAAGDVA